MSCPVEVECEKLIQYVIAKEHLVETYLKYSSRCKPADGYLSNHNFIEIIGTNKVLKLFVKTSSTDKTMRKNTHIRNAFLNEIHFYETIVPAFYSFQIECGFSHPLALFPKCYATCSEESKEVIILENLVEQGYSLYDRKITMDKTHIEYVLKEYGKFHALSIAMKNKNRKLYDTISSNIVDIHCNSVVTEDYQSLFKNLIEMATESLKPLHNDSVLNAFKNFSREIFSFLKRVSQFIDDYSVINHGDGWCNNFMFKYKDSKTHAANVRFLDWQLLKVGSPVFDVSYFFYCSSSKEEMNNLEYYLKFYYEHFALYLEKFKCNPELLFPYSILTEHWKKFSRYGLIMSLLVIKIMLTESEEVNNQLRTLTEGKNLEESFNFRINNEHIYLQRIQDIIIHFIENDLLI